MEVIQLQPADLPQSRHCRQPGPTTTTNTSTATATTATTFTTTRNEPFPDDPFRLMAHVDDEMTACEGHLAIILQARTALPNDLAERCAEDVEKAEAGLRRAAAFARECKVPWAYVFGGRNFGEGARDARKEQEANLRRRVSDARRMFEAVGGQCEGTRAMVVAMRRALEALGERADGSWGVISELRERQVEVYHYSDAEICIKVRHKGEPPRTEVLRAHERGIEFWERQRGLFKEVLEMERVLVSTAAKCAVAAVELRDVGEEKELDEMIRGVERVVEVMREKEANEDGCEKPTSWGKSLWAESCSRVRFW